MPTEATGSGPLRSVSLACNILDVFMEDEELGVTEIARRIGVAKSTAHRLLRTLALRGFVEQSMPTSNYRLGVRLVELGDLSRSRMELRHRSVTLLETLREMSGMTVNLAVPHGVDALFLERLSTLRTLPAYSAFRRSWPLHVTSVGKVMCAFDPVLADERIEAGLGQFAAGSITSKQRFRSVLDDVRHLGHAVSIDEAMPGFASIAAPVLDHAGAVHGAISLSGAAEDLGANHGTYVRMVATAARKLTASMIG